MKHRYVGYLKQMLALFLVMCLGMSFIPEAKASPSDQSTYMLPLECHGEYTYLNVLQNKDTWLVEAEGLCAMSDCQLEQSSRKVTLSRGDTGIILYTTGLDDCVVQGEQVYLPPASRCHSSHRRLLGGRGPLSGSHYFESSKGV